MIKHSGMHYWGANYRFETFRIEGEQAGINRKKDKRIVLMKRRFAVTVIGLIIGLGLILIWLNFVDIREVSNYLRYLKAEFVVLSLLFYIFAYLIRSLRWKVLLQQVQEMTLMKTFLILMAGNFTNYLIPIRAGEIMKCYFIKKLHGTRMSKTLPSVFIDKLFDMTGIFIVLLLLLILPVTLPPALSILIAIILIILVAGCLVLFSAVSAKEKIIGFLKKLLFFIPVRFEEKLAEIIRLFIDGLALFKNHKKIIVPVVTLSVLAVFFDSFFFYSIFLAFGVKVNYFYVLLGYTLIYLSYIIPHPPAQMGSNELIMILIFVAGFGLPADMSGAVMLFSHLLTGIVIVTIGIGAYSYAGIELWTIINKGEELYD